MCLVRITNAILGGENTIITVSNYDKENDVFIGLPAILNNEGVKEKIYVTLNKEEEKKLTHSIQVIKDAINNIKWLLYIKFIGDKMDKSEFEKFMSQDFNSFSSWLFSLNSYEFTFIASLAGFAIAPSLTLNEQNSLGNFFELLGQVILTINAQGSTLKQNKAQKSSIKHGRELETLEQEILKLKDEVIKLRKDVLNNEKN